VQIFAPFGRDAHSIAAVLSAAGVPTTIHDSLARLAEALDDDVGVVVVTEEAVAKGTAALLEPLSRQPSWSDIPFILLRSPRSQKRPLADAGLKLAINIIELDRPLGSSSLLSSVRSALRARDKQFLVRDQMRALADGRAALERSEAELRLVADAMPVLIAFIDRDLHYRFANKAYEAWF